MNIINSEEAIKGAKGFMADLNSGNLKLEIEPQIGEDFEPDETYMEERLKNYQEFLKSDLCKEIMKIGEDQYDKG